MHFVDLIKGISCWKVYWILLLFFWFWKLFFFVFFPVWIGLYSMENILNQKNVFSLSVWCGFASKLVRLSNFNLVSTVLLLLMLFVCFCLIACLYRTLSLYKKRSKYSHNWRSRIININWIHFLLYCVCVWVDCVYWIS